MALPNHFPFNLPHWNNLKIIHENILAPRSRFLVYESEADALARDSSKAKVQSLNGTWRFSHVSNPLEAIDGFQNPDFDSAAWDNIQVPGIWQLQGHGIPQYSNINYTFPVDPPNVPYEGNETGSYLLKFSVQESWKDSQLRLRFDGVDSAFKIWINGSYVGYSEGARNPSEFDVSSFVEFGRENILAVQVYKWCNGSYIEDQDQWRFSGIFRDVTLLAFPINHIEDVQISTLLDDDYIHATLKVKVKLSHAMPVEVKLLDAQQTVIGSSSKDLSDVEVGFSIPVQSVQKWSCDCPYLYRLIVSFPNGSITQTVGFRRVEIKGGLLLVNGNRICFRGVNRHEHHPDSGRTVPYDFLKKDLLLMKSYNVNAIRTSHQPSHPDLYDLADELGLWIIDEADVECHGFEEIQEAALTPEEHQLGFYEKKLVTRGKAAQWTTNNPDWEESYVDRARQLVARDKNHASVILWSMGNEAFYGSNFQAMYNFIKSYDDTRPIHYEGDHDAVSSDIYSCMYPEIESMIEFVLKKEHQDKPLILCEYIHAMGNGPGGIQEYIDAFYKYPNLQGGCAWEWANHGLKTYTSAGESYYGYGGDFGDFPNAYNFVLDGLIFSNHEPAPGLIEYKKAIEPVRLVSGGSQEVRIVNRYDVTSLDHLKCVWSLVQDGFKSSESELSIPTGILPSQEAVLQIPDFGHMQLKAESYLQLRFLLKDSTVWGVAGHEVAWAQVEIVAPIKLPPSIAELSQSPTIELLGSTTLKITGESSVWEIDLISGTLSSWKKGVSELIHSGLVMDFYRALTDNDSPGPLTDHLSPSDGAEWRRKRLDQTSESLRSISWGVQDGLVLVTIIKRVAPTVLEWSIDTETTYIFSSTTLRIKVKGKPQGINTPKTLARIGLTMSLNKDLSTVSWFGRGPGESYSDKKLSQRFGNWKSPVKDLFTDYEYPQESANRTDVRWVEFSDGDGERSKLRASFGDQPGCSFMASHYTTKAIETSLHPYELHKKALSEVVVRLDWQHHGLGTASCGPRPRKKYILETKPFEHELLLE